MKNRISLLGIIAVVAMIGFVFTACGGDDENMHTHTFNKTWSYNVTQHWKECADFDAKTEIANHAPANGVCTTCGYGNIPGYIEMVQIPAGTFTMGTVSGGYDESPVRQVKLSAFIIGKYEVTQEQYREVMGENPSYFSPEAGETQVKRPVERVTWFDAIEFCNKLSVKEGLTPVYSFTGVNVTEAWEANGYRLPTEAQWEYACRAGSTTDWYFGDTEADLVNYAWYSANANGMTHQIGKKTANAWGLYDMHGNVWEWCWDWYGSSYYGESGNTYNPMGSAAGTDHVIRGGGWFSLALSTHSTYRLYNPVEGYFDIGFRVVRQPHTHISSTTWTSDAAQHWKECTVAGCDAITGTANHTLAHGLCTTCGYGTLTHTYSTTWLRNATQHWKECTFAGCDAKTETANHTLAHGLCTTCGYGTLTHTYSTTWTSNAAQHWKECTFAGCDAKTETSNHAPANGVCTTCGYDNTLMQMVSINAGTLTWDSATITLSAFKMGKYEVTQEQYLEVMGVNLSYFSSNPAAGEVQGKRPVECVTWFDAIEFCNKLSLIEGLTPVYTITGRTPATGYPIQAATVTATWENNGYRLPTEAQWEYACRAGSTTDWYFGDTESELVNYAWYEANSNSMTHQVGKKTANAWGLHDMHGNVWEWCWDWYGTLPTSNQTDYKGTGAGTIRVLRGGSWSDSAGGTRSADRSSDAPDVGDFFIGFRVVRP